MVKFILAVAFMVAFAVPCDARLLDRKPVRKGLKAVAERVEDRPKVARKVLAKVVHPFR